jgi:hypothetical protein
MRWRVVGSMGRRVRLTVVAEDKQQEMFVRRVLYGMGFTKHDLVFHTCPKGALAGTDFVTRVHARELGMLRAIAHAQPNAGLVTVIDGDDHSVVERHRQLDEAGGTPKRTPTDRIAYVVPKRNIETWLRFFAGQPTDEVNDYKRRGQQPVDCTAAAAAFVSDPEATALPSIATAHLELRRIR